MILSLYTILFWSEMTAMLVARRTWLNQYQSFCLWYVTLSASDGDHHVICQYFCSSWCTWPFQLQTVIITWVLINSSGRGPTPIVGTKVTDQSQLSPASTQYTEVNCSLTKAEIEPGRKVVRLTLMHRQHRCRILFTHNMQTKTLKCSMGIRILELKSPTNYL